MDEIRELQSIEGILTTVVDQCQYGLTTRDKWREASARQEPDQVHDQQPRFCG